MLELKNITKDYIMADSTYTALKGISLQFRNSEFVSILGPSGCGKTTLLNIIGGLDHFTTGDLIINGKSTKDYKSRDWDTYRNHTIGFVFQSYNLIPHQTILQNVELALSIGGIKKKERKERAIKALQQVGLKEHINKKPNQLSGGQCQRVSIARALVNNPNIILADEPTGALDSDTSIQVMNILKEISKDRLVIMVTHNPDLAQKYSTRIIKMLDGTIKDDSNPISEKEFQELQKQQTEQELKKQEELSKANKKSKKKKERKAAMSYLTSANLSFKNLLTKKKRTFITSLACSIGIIGIAVILSVSAGMKVYVNNVQQDSASMNYISIQQTNSSWMDNLLSSIQVDLPRYPENTTGIYPYEPSSSQNATKQILSEDYVNYIETNINKDDLVIGIDYTHDTALNILTENDGTYSKVNTNNWTQILDNTEYVSAQYDVLYTNEDGKTFPTEFNEVALVVDSYNRLSTTILDRLGISYDADLHEIPYSDIIGKEFKLILNDDYYYETTTDDKTVYQSISGQTRLQNAYENGVTLKIVSILRQKENANGNWISTGIGYTTNLTEYILENNKNSAVVQAQLENTSYNITTGENFSTLPTSSNNLENNLVRLGAISTPSAIYIYPRNFDSKDEIIKILDNWNNSEIYKLYGNEKDENGNYIADSYQVKYTDVSELMASMMSDIIDIITYALIAFSAISLVVSSIMISIITYASVIERTKEIGVLRSLGARKKDISRVFMAEATIIGLVSAAIAIIVTLILNLIINLVLSNLVGVSNIAQLNVGTAFAMIALCIILNLLASLIPANIASKKDPVVALRSE